MTRAQEVSWPAARFVRECLRDSEDAWAALLEKYKSLIFSIPIRQLIHMLFFEAPARPYREVALSLGLAEGSIGFIRGRCLTRLRRQLEKMGFR